VTPDSHVDDVFAGGSLCTLVRKRSLRGSASAIPLHTRWEQVSKIAGQAGTIVLFPRFRGASSIAIA